MEVCNCTTRICGPNVKGCGLLLICQHIGSAMDYWESNSPRDLCPWSHTIVIWKSCFPAIHWLKITSYCLTSIFFAVLICVPVYYFYWMYHSKLVFSVIFKIPRLLFWCNFWKFEQWVFTDNITEAFCYKYCSWCCIPLIITIIWILRVLVLRVHKLSFLHLNLLCPKQSRNQPIF